MILPNTALKITVKNLGKKTKNPRVTRNLGMVRMVNGDALASLLGKV